MRAIVLTGLEQNYTFEGILAKCGTCARVGVDLPCEGEIFEMSAQEVIHFLEAGDAAGAARTIRARLEGEWPSAEDARLISPLLQLAVGQFRAGRLEAGMKTLARVATREARDHGKMAIPVMVRQAVPIPALLKACLTVEDDTCRMLALMDLVRQAVALLPLPHVSRAVHGANAMSLETMGGFPRVENAAWMEAVCLGAADTLEGHAVDMERLEIIATSVSAPADRVEALSFVMVLQAAEQSSLVESTLCLAREGAEALDERERPEALHRIARALAFIGRTDEARALILRIEDDGYAGQAAWKLSEADAREGDLERAIEDAKGIRDSVQRAQAMSLVAQSLASAGRLAEAEALIPAPGVAFRDDALAGVAAHCAARGNAEYAERLAMQVDSPYRRSGCLIDLAASLGDARLLERAKDESRGAVRGMPAGWLCDCCIQGGFVGEGIALARDLLEPGEGAWGEMLDSVRERADPSVYHALVADATHGVERALGTLAHLALAFPEKGDPILEVMVGP